MVRGRPPASRGAGGRVGAGPGSMAGAGMGRDAHGRPAMRGPGTVGEIIADGAFFFDEAAGSGPGGGAQYELTMAAGSEAMARAML
jgi:hypothetical protein